MSPPQSRPPAKPVTPPTIVSVVALVRRRAARNEGDAAGQAAAMPHEALAPDETTGRTPRLQHGELQAHEIDDRRRPCADNSGTSLRPARPIGRREVSLAPPHGPDGPPIAAARRLCPAVQRERRVVAPSSVALPCSPSRTVISSSRATSVSGASAVGARVDVIRRRQRTGVRDPTTSRRLVAVARDRAWNCDACGLSQRAPDRANGSLSAPSETTMSAQTRSKIRRVTALTLGDEQHERLFYRDEWHRSSVLRSTRCPGEDERAEREAHEENANRRLRRLRRWTGLVGSRR
jgi:hypothetical protein